MDENRSRLNGLSSDYSVDARRKRRRERARRRKMRWLGIMIALAVCGILLLVFLLPEKEPSSQETQPPVTTAVDTNPTVLASTAPITEPVVETTLPATVPPTTVPETTQPPTEFSIENSPSYRELLSLPNAENYLCNEFGYNFLEIFAEFIDCQAGFMEAYPEKWHLKLYADAAASLTCHTRQQEDGTYRAYEITIYDGNDIMRYGEVGVRYFTDIPREEISAWVYGAEDSIGVDETIKELFIDYILYSDTFAWSVLEPEFRSEWHYEIVTIWPYPEYEPDTYFDQLRLCVDVWRPGMAEDDRYHFWLIYDQEQNEVGLGYDLEGNNYDEIVLTGIVSKG